MPRPGVPFTLREAEHFGLTREHLRHRRFVSPFRGVWVLGEPNTTSFATPNDEISWLAGAYARVMKAEIWFSHSTALLLHGCPIRAQRTLHVSVNFDAHSPVGKDIIGHRYRAPLTGKIIAGLPVVAPETAIVQAGRELPLTELVVAIDHLMKPTNGGSARPLTPETLQAALAATSLKGVANARRAFTLSRVGAESRMETILRLKLESLGVTDLELQVNLTDADGFIGRFDLVDRARRRIYEYDGEQHRTSRKQYLKDQVRLERVRDAGWRVVRFHYEDLFVHPYGVRRKLAGLVR